MTSVEGFGSPLGRTDLIAAGAGHAKMFGRRRYLREEQGYTIIGKARSRREAYVQLVGRQHGPSSLQCHRVLAVRIS